MDIELQYFDGCPNWEVAYERLMVLAAERPDIIVTLRAVETQCDALRVGFHGSPTILVNGVDKLVATPAPVGLVCRRYVTPDGFAGAPTIDQLRAVLPPSEDLPNMDRAPSSPVIRQHLRESSHHYE